MIRVDHRAIALMAYNFLVRPLSGLRFALPINGLIMNHLQKSVDARREVINKINHDMEKFALKIASFYTTFKT
jgi:hypothetical protein